jgi:hypothetical protein
MEALLATTIKGLARTEKIVESNARAIEAWGDRIEEGIAEAEEVTSQATANLGQRVADLENTPGSTRCATTSSMKNTPSGLTTCWRKPGQTGNA